MKLATQSFLLTFLFLTASCETLKNSGVTLANINSLLAGITDQQTAEQAKAPLDGAIGQLKAALSGVQQKIDDGKATGEGVVNQGKSMIDGVLAQFGINADTSGMISGLMQNPAVKQVLGSSLTDLMGLLPSM